MAASQILILFTALVAMAAISPSSVGGEPSGDPAIIAKLKLFCSHNGNHYSITVCWKIMEPQVSRFKSADPKEVVVVAIDLAKASAERIRNHFNRLQQQTKDDKLKKDYGDSTLCYGGVMGSLDALRMSLESNDHQKIENALGTVIEMPEGCLCDNDIMKTQRAYTHLVMVAVGILIYGYP